MYFLVGLVAVVASIWWMAAEGDQPHYHGRHGPAAGLIAGVGFLGLSLAELVHRLRRGPLPPGRHQRD